jgi:hypothetical protein
VDKGVRIQDFSGNLSQSKNPCNGILATFEGGEEP